jgi:hypothetical protein
MDFELLVFTVDPEQAQQVTAAGAAAVIVDWENKGKPERQAGADTEINNYGPEELLRLSRKTRCRLICRVNGMHSHSKQEIESAIRCGASEILLPMVRQLDEVERLLEWTNGRCQASILIETCAAVALAPRLNGLPLHRIYVGLNDLAIDRNSSSLFDPVADGTLDKLRSHITAIPFGFGGLTLPEAGHPIPCRLLRGELVRLNCSFTFLRRSFWRDMQGRDLQVEVPRILESVVQSRNRTPQQVEQDRIAFQDAVQRLGQEP